MCFLEKHLATLLEKNTYKLLIQKVLLLKSTKNVSPYSTITSRIHRTFRICSQVQALILKL